MTWQSERPFLVNWPNLAEGTPPSLGFGGFTTTPSESHGGYSRPGEVSEQHTAA